MAWIEALINIPSPEPEPPAPPVLVPWNTGTDEEITTMINAYYEGNITLAEIQEVWHIGDARTITLNAMEATNVGESHRGQQVEIQILDFNHDLLVTPIGNITKSLITVDLKNCLRDANVTDTDGENNTENGYINPTNYNLYSWNGCSRRTWCNSIFKNALPSYIKILLKQVYKSTADMGNTVLPQWVANTDYCFLLSEMEIFGLSYQYSAETGENSIHYINTTGSGETITMATGGTQYAWYDNDYRNGYKLPRWKSGSTYYSNYYWQRSPRKSNVTDFCCIGNTGAGNVFNASSMRGLAPAFCL